MPDRAPVVQPFKVVCAERRIPLAELARAIDYTPAYLTAVANLRRAPSMPFVLAVAGHLELPPSQLFLELAEDPDAAVSA